MPVVPTRSVPPTAEPGTTLAYPWRFLLGQHIYAIGHVNSVQVVGGELWMGWPHLHCADWSGKTWRIPQIHCSSKPLTPSA